MRMMTGKKGRKQKWEACCLTRIHPPHFQDQCCKYQSSVNHIYEFE